MDISRGIRIGVSRRVVFVLLAGFAFLVLSAVFSKPARADLLGPVLPLGETLQSVGDVVDSVIPDPVAGAVSEILPPVVQETVSQVVQTVPAVVETVTDVLPPAIDETVTTVVTEIVSPVAEEIGELVPSPTPATPVEPVPVDGAPGLTSPPSPAATRPVPTGTIADSTLSDHQDQREEVAVLGVVEQVTPAHPAGRGALSSPSGPDPVQLYGYVPIAGQRETQTGGASTSLPASSNLFGANYGDLSMSPVGFLAILAVLFNFAVVGYLRDRASSGRSFFPGHSGRPG